MHLTPLDHMENIACTCAKHVVSTKFYTNKVFYSTKFGLKAHKDKVALIFQTR